MANKQDELIPISGDSIGGQTQKQNERRFATIETLVYAVVFVALVSLVGIVVAVCTLVIDQMHFNNETYREQSINLQSQVQVLQTEIQDLKK
jgi:hypothetical protein